MRKPKLLIIGHGRHGKDTVSEILCNDFKLSFISSSMFACKKFIYDELKDKYEYKSFEECYDDRHNHDNIMKGTWGFPEKGPWIQPRAHGSRAHGG